jgi:hypothetical protein
MDTPSDSHPLSASYLYNLQEEDASQKEHPLLNATDLTMLSQSFTLLMTSWMMMALRSRLYARPDLPRSIQTAATSKIKRDGQHSLTISFYLVIFVMSHVLMAHLMCVGHDTNLTG